MVVPRAVIGQAGSRPLLSGMIPTDVGYFPHAQGHGFTRTEGIDQAILIYCVTGSGWCQTAEGVLPVTPGELLVVPPGLAHKYGADRHRPWTIHWVHAKGLLVSPFLQELGAPGCAHVRFVGKDAHAVALFDEVLQIVEDGYGFSQLLQAGHALSHLYALLTRLSRESSRDASNSEQRVARSIEYLRTYLDQPLDVPKLAKLAGLSTSHYSAVFKARTGYAPIDYLTRARVHQACQLLDTTSHSVKSIAARVGYADPLYFSRVFRAINDASPSEYRQTRKG